VDFHHDNIEKLAHNDSAVLQLDNIN